VDLFQQRLFRLGNKCTLLTDADEIILANPLKYSSQLGLKNYLKSFQLDDQKKHFRAFGYILAHVTEKDENDVNDETNTRYLEKPIDWEAPVLEQRRFWSPQAKYNKPLLSKSPVRYKPGFHNLYIPARFFILFFIFFFYFFLFMFSFFLVFGVCVKKMFFFPKK
jgi:hypothetical protein